MTDPKDQKKDEAEVKDEQLEDVAGGRKGKEEPERLSTRWGNKLTD